MFFLNQYDNYLPTQILGILIVLGILLMVLLELYLVKIRKIKHAKIISGIVWIILGSNIIIVAIWGDIGWEVYSEQIQYPVLGIRLEFPFLLYISMIITVVLITHGIILIHKYRIRE